MYLLVQNMYSVSDAKFKIFVTMPRNYFFRFRQAQSSTGPLITTSQLATDRILWIVSQKNENKFAPQKLIYSVYSVMDQNFVYGIDFKILIL